LLFRFSLMHPPIPGRTMGMGKIAQITAVVAEILLPTGCALCGADLFGSAASGVGLCAVCAARLEPEAGRRCPSCGRPLISERDVCMECRSAEPPGCDRTHALYRYGGDGATVLRAFKFGANRALAAFFALRLIEAATSLASETGPIEAWVPVPPRPGKIRKTGWDQVEAIARILEQLYNGRRTEAGTLPVRRCLERLPSRSQKELNRGERGKNLIGKIRCVRPAPTSALVFDDVITTGATLNACAGALKKAGTLRVYAIALFYD